MDDVKVVISDKDWRDITDFYFQVKALVAFTEISNREQNLCLSAITELRSALDHLMRVKHVLIFEGQQAEIPSIIGDDPRPRIPENHEAWAGYCRSNFLKTKGHLYRAAFDALDALVQANILEYWELRAPFDFDDICSVLPDFPNSDARIEQAKRMVVQCKMFKDIESEDSLEEIESKIQHNGEVIEKYLLAHKLIMGVQSEIKEHSLEIRAAVRRRKKAFLIPILIGVCTSLAAAVLNAAAVWIVQFLPAPQSGQSDGTPPPAAHQTPLTEPPASPGDLK